MRRALLDVNVLLALLDSDHVDHQRAHEWLDGNSAAGWSSCSITENGFVRVISQPRYPSPVPPAEAIELLAQTRRDSDHEFWACEVSLLDPNLIDRSRLHGHRQITDSYLLALAVAYGGRLVTFGDSLPLSAVHGADEGHLTVL
ncbi:TA system VapC family ribonuclease toxin [Actinopolyspora halophila]|uniref:TA system VapC family ribonuclease toxin n=1 Tax=Actinopolyspora halophila TaxID=1850 RepID=UPI000362C9F1|nr:TA system VapC family ribonuclease toxin [Actinopolyspora halophila]